MKAKLNKEELSFEDVVKNIEDLLNSDKELFYSLKERNSALKEDLSFITDTIKDKLKHQDKEDFPIKEGLRNRVGNFNIDLLYLIVMGDLENIMYFCENYVLLINNFAIIINDESFTNQCICIERLLKYDSNFELMIALSYSLLDKYRTMEQYSPRAFTLSRNYLEVLEKKLGEKEQEAI